MTAADATSSALRGTHMRKFVSVFEIAIVSGLLIGLAAYMLKGVMMIAGAGA